MKTKLLAAILAVFLGGMPLANAADYSYYWDANYTTNGDTSVMGGDGRWNNTSVSFWDVANQTHVTGNRIGGTGTAGEHNVYFNAGVNIIKDDYSALAAGSGVMANYTFFIGAGTTNITAADNVGSTAGINSANASMTYNVGTGSILNFSGTNNAYLRLAAGTGNVSRGIFFQGGGTVNFNNNAYIAFANNGMDRITVEGGTTVNFNAGSAIYGTNGDASTPYSQLMNRMVVNNATFNLNGGDVYLGGFGHATSYNVARSWGLGIGTTGEGRGEVNIYSGNLTALGNTQTSANTTQNAGISFGINQDSASGGTLNLYGGNLIVSNIRANTNVYAVLNLDGGTIYVTTADAGPGLTADEKQIRLDNFITGFQGTDTSKVVIGSNGVTIDTSLIDSSTVNTAMATIRSSVYGSGNLTKTGDNTLLMSGAHYYTGETIIAGGTLAVGTLTGNAEGISIRTSSKITVKDGAIFDTTLRKDYYLVGYDSAETGTVRQILTNEGSGKVVGNINAWLGIVKPNGTFLIEGDVTSSANQSTFQFDNLGTDILKITGSLSLADGVSIDLSGASILEGTYNLFLADSITFGDLSVTGASGDYNYSFAIDSSGVQQALQMTVTAIPEPSTYALIMVLGAVAVMIYRRRK